MRRGFRVLQSSCLFIHLFIYLFIYFRSRLNERRSNKEWSVTGKASRDASLLRIMPSYVVLTESCVLARASSIYLLNSVCVGVCVCRRGGGRWVARTVSSPTLHTTLNWCNTVFCKCTVSLLLSLALPQFCLFFAGHSICAPYMS